MSFSREELINIYSEGSKLDADILIFENPNSGFDFDILIFIKPKNKKRVYFVHDSGCSCPFPFENCLVKDINQIEKEFQNLEQDGALMLLDGWVASLSISIEQSKRFRTRLIDFFRI